MEDGKRVTFESDSGTCPGVMFGDPELNPSGLVVIHAWWGMNETILKDAKMVGDYCDLVTMVPDFYRGKVCVDREEASHSMAGLNWKGAVQDVQAAARYLLSKGCKRVGVVGFCMGGAIAFLASILPEIHATAPFYGIPTPEHGGDQMIHAKIPIQAHMALQDHVTGLSTPDIYLPYTENLKKHGVNLELIQYDSTHAFFSLDEKARDESLVNLKTFMTKHLKQ